MSRPFDRRKLVSLLLAGVSGAALAETGVPVAAMKPWEGPAPTIDSVRRTVAGLAALYDQAGPRKVAGAAAAAEPSIQAVFTEFGRLPAEAMREAKAVYGQLLTLSANAADDMGRHAAAARTADLAACLAEEVGDAQTAGHAWSVAAGARLWRGDHRGALDTARRARAHAGDSPSAVMALLAQAEAAAALGRADDTRNAVGAAESLHARLPARAWGTPGYSLGTFHPAHLYSAGGAALNKVGLHAEAAPRLDDAADLARGTGLMVFVWLCRAWALLGTGDVDDAHAHAAMAVASAETRPAAWVAAWVAALDARAGGALGDLVDATSRWGLPVGEI